MIFGIQIIAILFAGVMTYFAYVHYKQRAFSMPEFSFWLVFWVAFVFITIFPYSVDFLVRTFSLNRAMDLVMIIGFFVITGITFRNVVETKHLGQKLENLIREDALKNAQTPPSSPSAS